MPFQKGHKLGLGNKYRLGKEPWNKDLKGVQVAWNKGKHTGNYGNGFQKGNHPKSELKKGYIMPEETRMKISRTLSLGGSQTDRHKEMQRLIYKLWRKAVFERDNYTCQKCFKRGGRLQADHIKPWALFPELRYAIDNGRTLCLKCHKETNTYGWKMYHYNKILSN